MSAAKSSTKGGSETDKVFRELFGDHAVVAWGKTGAERAAALPMTDFCMAVRPDQHEALITLFSSAVPSWEGVTAIVGLAERNAGPLVHGLAHCRNLPYSLVNWYPEGSKGDIVVDHDSQSFGAGRGVLFLNGLSPSDTIVFLDVTLRKGDTSMKVLRAVRKAGVKIACAAFAAYFDASGGKRLLQREFGIPVVSLCTVDVSGPRSAVTSVVNVPRYRLEPAPTVAEIKALPLSAMRSKFDRVLQAFVGVEITRAKDSKYPYCNFPLTDFHPLLHPDLVECMADCMVYLGHFDQCDLLVSESDRGGGPLLVAVSRRTGLPFTLAGWDAPIGSPVVKGGSPSKGVAAQVGYSGSGDIYVNGVSEGTRCIFVDDMMSSGGTAEALFHAIKHAGGKIVEAHFASEKVDQNGRVRLGKNHSDVPLISLCYFSAAGPKTVAALPTPLGNDTPIQKVPTPSSGVDLVLGRVLHYALVAGIIALYAFTSRRD